MRFPYIVHLASTHRAFDTRIFHKECQSLAEAGYRVTLIVPHESSEVVDDVYIRAVPPPKSGKERLTRTLWQLYQAALEEPAEAVFHFHDAELLPYMLLLKAAGRRVVYDMHEDTPLQVMYQHWIPPLVRPLVATGMKKLERLGAAVFDGLIAAEPVIARRFEERAPVTVHNFPLASEIIDEAPPYAERPPQVAYVGTITEVRGIRELIAAVGMLPERLEARLALAGSFHPEGLRQEVETMPGWRRTGFLGWISREEMRKVLSTSRVGVVAFHPVERYRGNYPTKLFEYMAAGLPVVASDFEQLRPFVQESRCGILVDPLNPGAIAGAINWLLDHPEEAEAMGARGREAIRERYNWEGEAGKLIEFYERFDE